MELAIAAGAVALLTVAFGAFIVLLNIRDRRRRKLMTPEQRKDDDYEVKSFTQDW
jgi:hypothetical protein